MNETLARRLERYGNDLDAGITERPDVNDDARAATYVSSSARRSRVPHLAFAAACLVVAGVVGALVLGGGSGDAGAPATGNPDATDVTVPHPAETLDSISLAGSEGGVSVDVATPDGGVIEFFAEPTGPVGTRWTPPGEAKGTGGSGWRERDDGAPLIGSSTMPGAEVTYIEGAVGANGARVRVTMEDGAVVESDTLAVPGVPGARVFAVGVENHQGATLLEVLSASGTVLYSDDARGLVPPPEALEGHGRALPAPSG